MRIITTVALFLVCALGLGEEIPWKNSFEEAKVEAKKTGKLIFLEFYGET